MLENIKKMVFIPFAILLLTSYLDAAEKKNEAKPDLFERITLVLKYGNTSQVKDSLAKIRNLKEEEQRTLIPELRKLIRSAKDPGILLSLIQLIGDARWNDLDDELIPFLKSEDSMLLTSTASAINRKKITAAINPLREILEKSDYTREDRNLNDLINAYAGFHDPGLQAFFFDKLKDDNVLPAYKSFILKYLGSLPEASEDAKKYLLDIATDEKKETGIRINSVRALGNMGYEAAKEPFRKILDSIEGMSDQEKKKEFFFLRLELISALVKLKDDTVKTMLIEMTRDDDETVRIRAINRLSEFKSKEFVDLLEYKAKYDNSVKVQKAARQALEVIQGKSNAIEE